MTDKAINENLLWSVPLGDVGGGRLIPRPGGGCLAFSVRQIAAFDQRGHQLWAVPPTTRSPEAPVIGPHGTVARVEGDAVVVRDLGSGAVVLTHRARCAHPLRWWAWTRTDADWNSS